ncbi:hypothetical protein OpiT1DRAFT_01447 [Opitutaceae bacterium TAV1]|nr:hypothetical protein OpiT1DRAFT_01447 [Opitutaceae bacterium TAV1]
MKIPKTKTTGTPWLAFLAFLALAAPHARASTLLASDGAEYDYFGYLSVSGGGALAGVSADDDKGDASGSAYYFKGLDSATGLTVNEAVKLLASDGAASDWFGYSVSLSGDRALVGARQDDDKGTWSGSAFYYKGLDGKTGRPEGYTGPASVTTATYQDVKLLASDGATTDYFGVSVSLSGDSALVGAEGDRDDNDKGTVSGSAYYFKGLDNATGPTVNQDVKLLASDGANNDYFGRSVSLSGDSALVGAYQDDDKGSSSGSAYYYKGLDNKTGLPEGYTGPASVTTATYQDVKLLASDGAANDYFGHLVSLSGDSALIGAAQDDDKGSSSGSAYYFKGLDGKTGLPEGYTGPASVTTATYQDVKLLASDGAANDYFGYSVSLSGDSALVGAYWDDDTAFNAGAAYYFKGLDGKTGRPEGYTGPASVTTATYEDVKLLASDGAASDYFGYSVSLSGDRFVIAANSADPNGVSNAGKAYAGDIRAFTTLDAGGTVLATDGLSFVSQGDWIIGEATSGNGVTLSKNATTGIADTATVTATGKAVYIGKNAGSNNNILIMEGTLVATDVYVGAAGNTGNRVEFSGDWSAVSTLHIAVGSSASSTFAPTLLPGQTLEFTLGASGENGEFSADEITFGGTLRLVAGTGFVAADGAEWDLIWARTLFGTFDVLDFFALAEGYEWDTGRLYTDGIVAIIATSAVPEPATYAALAGLAILGWAAQRRRCVSGHRGEATHTGETSTPLQGRLRNIRSNEECRMNPLALRQGSESEQK